jgi:hypothetical protein
MKRRIAVVALVVLGALAGCGGKAPAPDAGDPGGEGELGTATAAPTEVTTPPAPVTTTPSDTTDHPAGNPLACSQLPTARVGSASVPLADYGPGSVSLSAGAYDSPDGRHIRLGDECAIGDLNRDGVFDALSFVRIDFGGTGIFYTLVAWTSNNSGTPQLAASTPLGDRNGVDTITIAGNVATVVYYTRTDDVPMAGVNIRRTATFELRSSGLVETGHTDEPCGPCW